MGQNGTRGVGRKVKVGRPIFQAFLPLFLWIFLFSFLARVRKDAQALKLLFFSHPVSFDHRL